MYSSTFSKEVPGSCRGEGRGPRVSQTLVSDT